MHHRLLNRRAVLKAALAGGAALTVPLPIFDALLNESGTAYAATGQALAKRYCTWFFGNGISPPLWVPASTGSGASWELSQQLAPLKNVKSSLTVVSGLKNMLPNATPHPAGSAASTTGAPLVSKKATLKSIDQLVLPLLKSTAPTIEIGVSNATPNGSELTLKAVSHGDNGTPNYPDFDPKSVFTTMFSNLVTPTSGTGNTAAADQLAKLNAAKKSVLDLVMADANELNKILGTSDQKRLQQHLDGIRQLETRLTGMSSGVGGATCSKPASPTVGKDAKSEAPSAVNDVMADLMTMAFACNVTQSASFVFTLPAAHVFYRGLGTDMNDDFHDTICHTDAGDAAHQTRVNRGVIYAMTCFATFLEKMSAIKEGSSTLLDNSLIYASSCTAWGKVHGTDDWPVLLAGKAGGALKGDTHVRAAGQNLSQILFSIQQILGGAPASAGAGAGKVTTGAAGPV